MGKMAKKTSKIYLDIFFKCDILSMMFKKEKFYEEICLLI